ncbi:MAG: phosphoribosylanthranilate isomerase [Opitutales bacterium]
MKVKVCGITSAEDGEAALALGADFLGLNLYSKSPRAVSVETARMLCNTFPAGRRVFVDVNTGSEVLEDYGDLGFDKFQIHCAYETSLVTLAAWAGIVGRENLWVAPKWPPGEPFPEGVLEFCDTVLIDAYAADKHGGTGRTADWGLFSEVANRYPGCQFILAGGLGPENLVEAVAASGASMVDVNSGVETAPGKKDREKLRELFGAVAGLDPARQ